MAFDLDPSYKQVSERLADLKSVHPDAVLRPANPDKPFEIVDIGGKQYLVYTAACYRTPDDPMPAIASAWEPYPGRTPYTRDSELMNAETSAWGRAVIASLRSESKAIASAEDVRNRRAEQEVADAGPAAPPIPAGWDDADECESEHRRLAARIKALAEADRKWCQDYRAANGWPLDANHFAELEASVLDFEAAAKEGAPA